MRTRWAVAGSGKVPNSSRSPPLQNEGPAPSTWSSTTEGSATTVRRAATSSSRIAAPNALCTVGRLSVMRTRAPSRATMTGGSAGERVRAAGRGGQPARELGPGLQHRVHRRFGEQAAPHVEGLAHPKELHERDRSHRAARDRRREIVDLGVGDHHVESSEPCRRSILRRAGRSHGHGHAGQRPQRGRHLAQLEGAARCVDDERFGAAEVLERERRTQQVESRVRRERHRRGQ